MIDSTFTAGSVDAVELAAMLDEATDEERVAAVMGLNARQQAILFDAVEGFRPLGLDHFVPLETPLLHAVDHHGRNSLPMFRRFAKRFCRPEDDASVLWGYNRNPRLIQPVTGPGYFLCYSAGVGEVVIDYCDVPSDRPDGWPKIRPNSAGLSHFIYHNTKDTMRGVSEHVSVGRAARAGKPMDNWFVLCR